VVRNELRWLTRQRPREVIGEPTVVVGSAMVADGYLRAAPYVEWVRGLAAAGPVRYLPHRRQTFALVERLRTVPGVVVDEAGLPVELRLTALRAPQRVVMLPTTAFALLPRILAGSGVGLEPVTPPASWWLPDVPDDLRAHLTSVVPA
jgi:hypothetical protein